MKHTRSLAAAFVVASASAMYAQIGAIGVVNTLQATTDYGPLAQVGATTYYPYLFSATGSGTGVSIGGDVQDFFAGHAPGDIGYTFNGLNLDVNNFVSGGPGGTSTSPYIPGVGSSFAFTLDGDTIALGVIQTFDIFTDFDDGFATGTGTILMTGPGAGPDFFAEINAITGGANIVTFHIDSFLALSGNFAGAQFESEGSFSFPAAPIPEPSTYAALAGLGVLALAAVRRRR